MELAAFNHLSRLEKSVFMVSLNTNDMDEMISAFRHRMPAMARIHAAGPNLFHNHSLDIAKAALEYDGPTEVRQVAATQFHTCVDNMGHAFLESQYTALNQEISEILGRVANPSETHFAFERLADQQLYSTVEGKIIHSNTLSSLREIKPGLLEDIMKPKLLQREASHTLWGMARFFSEYFKTKNIHLTTNDLHAVMYTSLAYEIVRLYRKSYMHCLPKKIYQEQGVTIKRSDRLIDKVPQTIKEYILAISNEDIRLADIVWPEESDKSAILKPNGNNYALMVRDYGRHNLNHPRNM